MLYQHVGKSEVYISRICDVRENWSRTDIDCYLEVKENCYIIPGQKSVLRITSPIPSFVLDILLDTEEAEQ